MLKDPFHFCWLWFFPEWLLSVSWIIFMNNFQTVGCSWSVCCNYLMFVIHVAWLAVQFMHNSFWFFLWIYIYFLKQTMNNVVSYNCLEEYSVVQIFVRTSGFMNDYTNSYLMCIWALTNHDFLFIVSWSGMFSFLIWCILFSTTVKRKRAQWSPVQINIKTSPLMKISTNWSF